MKTSKKTKGKIYEATRKALSAQHKDSIEYGLRVFYPYTDNDKEMSALERNAHALFKDVEKIGDYTIHNIMAKLRGQFRELRRETLSTMAVNRYGKVHISHLQSLYDNMMRLTKEYLPKIKNWQDVCWFCRLKECDSFDTEFDTYLHVECLEKALDVDPKHPEAIHMKYLLEEELEQEA